MLLIHKLENPWIAPLCFLAPLLFSNPVNAVEPNAAKGMANPVEVAEACSSRQLEILKGKVAALSKASADLQGLASQPVPRELSYDESRKAHRYSQWLRTATDSLDELESKGHRLIKGCESRRREGGMPLRDSGMLEMQRSFNEQYLQLQNKIAHENRQFSMVSNIMKNRHETAKNSINNIR